MTDFENIIKNASMLGASDIHIKQGIKIRIRIDGDLENFREDIVLKEDIDRYLDVLSEHEKIELLEKGEVDLAISLSGERLRLNVFRSMGKFSIAVRILKNQIPDMSSLGLPEAVMNFPKLRKGIVLVTGETGSGKSTTIASIINAINKQYARHIITLEDPVEYIYDSGKSLISQRQIGHDTMSYAAGLRASLREDPDIINIGEMRDLETIETALTAAETGHLVFATLHSLSATDTADRIISVFPTGKQDLIRMQLSHTLKAVISQRLVKKKSGGRVAACELMIANNAVRNCLREGKTHQLETAIITSRQDGSITLDNSLKDLFIKGIISKDTALEHAINPNKLSKELLGMKGFKDWR